MMCALAFFVAVFPLLPWQDGQLRVDCPRPLAAAIRILEERHGWITNYEDPPYTNAGDTVVHNPVFSGSRRVVEPRSGRLEIEYAAGAAGGPEPHAAVLRSLLKDHEKHDNPGAFTMRVIGGMHCIVPAQGSILDVPITLQPKQRTFRAVVEDVARAVGAATGLRFRASVVSVAGQAQFSFGISGEPASAVLMRLFGEAGGRHSWSLLYFPESGFELNVR